MGHVFVEAASREHAQIPQASRRALARVPPIRTEPATPGEQEGGGELGVVRFLTRIPREAGSRRPVEGLRLEPVEGLRPEPVDGEVLDAGGGEPRLELRPRTARATTARDELLGEATIVEPAALDQRLDHARNLADPRLRVLARARAALTQPALDRLPDPLARRLAAGEMAHRLALQPARVEGLAVRGAPLRALGLGRARGAMRFHGAHATKLHSRTERRRPPFPLWRAHRHARESTVPELPEVETTRRRIAPLLVGRRIDRVVTTAPSYFFLTPPDALRRALEGRRVAALDRVGKYLVADVGGGDRLLLHLGMTGQLFSSEATSVRLLSATARASLAPDEQRRFEPDEHTHLRFAMEGGGPEVFFRDVRKFGKVQWLPAGQPNARLDRLGTDALELSGDALFAATRGRRVAIKAMLLDQSVAAGVGNIYADEALFLAGVRPGRAARRVTRRECDAIARRLQQVLRRSIETGGSSISDYVAPDGADGGYQDERRVYARTGEPCRDCGTPIKRRLVAQRSTHYCPTCQR